MNGKFTSSFLSIVFSSFFAITLSAQNCATPTGLSTSSVSNFNATLNWILDANAHHYKIKYRKLGTSNTIKRNNITTNSKDINNLVHASSYAWQVMGFCSANDTIGSNWSAVESFVTANDPVDCNNTPNGVAFIDSCGNCVGGTTNKLACIPFSPTVLISLSTLECDSLSDITFTISQDANEPDMSSVVFSSDAGSFDFSGLSTNDVIGSSVIMAGGGYLNATTTLLVDFIMTSDKISIKAVDDATGQIYNSFTIENSGDSIIVIASSLPDNNNVTSGNNQIILLEGLFVNPISTLLTFTSTIHSELSDVDNQSIPVTIACSSSFDCTNELGGTAFVDGCGNCVGGILEMSLVFLFLLLFQFLFQIQIVTA